MVSYTAFSNILDSYLRQFGEKYTDLSYSISKYFKRKKKISLSNYEAKKQFCEIKTLNFLFLNQIQNIDILKIDTEGYELNVLKGISSKNFKKISYIYFEHHYNNMLIKNYKFSQISNILKKNNFKPILKIKMSLRKSFEYIYKNKKIL